MGYFAGGKEQRGRSAYARQPLVANLHFPARSVSLLPVAVAWGGGHI